MKTLDEINHARGVLCERVQTPGLSDSQMALLAGMLNALVWVADGPEATTIGRLLAGEPLAAGNDAAAEFDNLRSRWTCPRCGRLRAHSLLRGFFCPTCDRYP